MFCEGQGCCERYSAGITLSYGCNQATQVICEGRLERRGNDFSFMSLQHSVATK